MTNILDGNRTSTWSLGEKIIFRITAIFFLLLTVPLAPSYWQKLASPRWGHFQDLFQLANYLPQFVAAPKWGFASYLNVELILGVSVLGGVAWSFFDRERNNYADLYDWLRIVLRYKLAIAIISYGIIKLFPLQFPALTLSDLNTNYGDFLPWKIYYLTNSAASAGYERTLGSFEILGGILLLWRRFATVGAGIIAAALVNIVLVNFAYQLGDHVYASILFLIALAILINDMPRVFDLLVWRRFARADHFDPAFGSWLNTPRLVLKVVILVFFLAYGAETYGSYRYKSWPYPEKLGLANAAGLYNVKSFVVNGNVLPYSTTDPVRWQNVVFEKWNTLSIRINRPVTISVKNPEIAFETADSARDYEFAGNGGRHFYSYLVDAADGNIHVVGKNDPRESFSFHLDRTGKGELHLVGLDQSGNRLDVTLDKVDKKYLLNEGRRKPLSLY